MFACADDRLGSFDADGHLVAALGAVRNGCLMASQHLSDLHDRVVVGAEPLTGRDESTAEGDQAALYAQCACGSADPRRIEGCGF